ncbi:MAG: DUF3857 domain-containing protein [Gemmataceae bacterium]
MMRFSELALWVVAVAWILNSTPAFAKWSVKRGPSQEPDPYRYEPQHLDKAPKAFFDDASACLVFYGATYLVDEVGTTSTITHEVTRLNGRRSVSALGEYRGILFYPTYQTLTLNEARVIKPDGQTIPVGPDNVKLRDATTDYQTYNLRKELVISFPGLQVGDVYEVKWTIQGKSPEFAGQFFNRYSFGSANYPVLRERVSVRLPKGKSWKYKIIGTAQLANQPEGGEGTPTRRVTSDRALEISTREIRTIPVQTKKDKAHIAYTWEVQNQLPLPSDDDLPPRGETRLQLMCSTYPSWAAIGRWKHRLRKNCWECTDGVRKIIEKVTGKLNTPEEKARALTYWVRQNVRYVSITSGKNRYTPQRPQEVLKNRYGDCKDQSQLLAVMLRELGLPVYQVSLGMRGDGQIIEEVPSPWATHAILMVEINGKDHWIDTTSTDAAWDFLPRVDRGRVVTLTDTEGNIKLGRTPELTMTENRFLQKTVVNVQPGGSTESVRVVSYRGHAGLVQRESWIDTPNGQRRQEIAAELRDSHSNSKLLGLNIGEKNLRDLDRPLNVALNFRISNHFSGTDYLEASFTDSHVWSRFLAYNPAPNRTQPLDLWGPFESFHQYEIALPPAYRFDPNNQKKRETIHSSKWGVFRVEVEPNSKDPRKLLITFHTRRSRWRVEPTELADYRAFRDKVYDSWRVWIGIRPTTVLADAKGLEKRLAKKPNDAVSARILARLYLRHKRIADANRVATNALKTNGRDKELWKLAAQATRTWEAEERVYRKMVQTFPTEQAFALELGRLRVNLKDLKRAASVLEPLVESNDDTLRSQAHYQFARLHWRRGRYRTALAYLKTARDADSSVTDTQEGWKLEGRLHLESGDTIAALAAYRKALQIEPNEPQLLRSLVRVAREAGLERNAIDFLRRYTLAVRRNLPGLVQAAQLHYEMGRLDDAFDCAMRARDIDFHADAQKILGLVHWKRRNYKKAIFHLVRANPDAESLTGLIRCSIAIGDYAGAVKVLRKADGLQTHPASFTKTLADVRELEKRKKEIQQAETQRLKNSRIDSAAIERFVCAELLARNNDAENSRIILDQVIKGSPTFSMPLALRGSLAIEKGELRTAEKDARTAIRLRSSDPLGHLVLGRVLLERKDPKAITVLEKAAKLTDRKDPEVLHWLAAALFADDQIVGAIITQRDAVDLAPQELQYRKQLDQMETILEK